MPPSAIPRRETSPVHSLQIPLLRRPPSMAPVLAEPVPTRAERRAHLLAMAAKRHAELVRQETQAAAWHNRKGEGR